jgi:hypothetical protein
MDKTFFKLFTLSIFIFISVMCFSQEMEDVVYLKNGSVIRGIIIEQIPNESIKIKTRDDNIFVYKLEEISKISKEESGAKSKSSLRYTGTFGFGLSAPLSDKDFSDSYKLGFNINATSGMLFSDNIGLRFDLRYNFFKGKTQSYSYTYYYTYYYTYTPVDLSVVNLNAVGLFGDFNKSNMVKPYGLFGLGMDFMSAGGDGKIYLGLDVGGGINFDVSRNSGVSINLEAKYHHNTNEGYAKGFFLLNTGITLIY